MPQKKAWTVDRHRAQVRPNQERCLVTGKWQAAVPEIGSWAWAWCPRVVDGVDLTTPVIVQIKDGPLNPEDDDYGPWFSGPSTLGQGSAPIFAVEVAEHGGLYLPIAVPEVPRAGSAS